MFDDSAIKKLLETLGIKEPIYAENLSFDEEVGAYFLDLKLDRGAKLDCSHCGEPNLPVYDTCIKVWRHLPICEYKLFIRFHTPRLECPFCKIKTWQVPWARPYSNRTIQFESMIMSLIQEMPVSKLAEFNKVSPTNLARIVNHYVPEAKKRRDLSMVKRIAIDETKTRKGKKYVTNVLDFDTRLVLGIIPDKKKGSVELFKKEFIEHKGNPNNITDVVMDMSVPYYEGIKEAFPNAKKTFDKFHVSSIFSRGQDKVRNREAKTHPELKNTRYAFKYNPKNLPSKFQYILTPLLKKRYDTCKFYKIRNAFLEIYDSAIDSNHARGLVKKWISWSQRCRVPEMKEIGKTIKSHIDGIIEFFNSRITSGPIEAMNRNIQDIRRRGKGFPNIKTFANRILLELGGLDLRLPAWIL